MVAKHVHAKNMEYGAYDFVEKCRGTECTNSKVCITALKRAKPSEIEKRKITIFTYLHLNKIFYIF